MTETLLFLNGQPVILTSDGTDSLGQNDTLSSGSQGQAAPHLENIKKELYESQGGREEPGIPTDGVDGVSSNVTHARVQVQVGGKEVPGFMLANQNVGTVNSMVGHSMTMQGTGYEILNSIKNENIAGNEAEDSEASEFLRLHDPSQQAVLTRDGVFMEEGGGRGAEASGDCKNEVFSLSSGGELLSQTEMEGNTVIENGLGSALDLQNIVRLPMVSNMDSSEQNMSAGNPDSDQQRNMGTILAIIQGDDGNTQTVELSQEEACRFNLQQLLGNEETSQTTPVKVEEPETRHASFQLQTPVKMERESELPNQVSPEVMQVDQVTGSASCESSSSDTDVSLEPFLLIPEYGADGSISMLRIHGSDPEPQQKSEVDPLSFQNQQVDPPQVPSKSPPMENAQVFQNLNPNVHKITIPSSTTQPVKRSSSKHKHIDWKTVTPRFRSLPRVPGSTYLRDIAKRTKFRNLTSFLNTKQPAHKSHIVEKEPEISESGVPHMHSITQPSTYHISVPGMSNAMAKISIPGIISSSGSQLIQSSVSGTSRGSTVRVIQTPQGADVKAAPMKLENMPIRLSLQPSQGTPTIRTGRVTALQKEPEPSNNRALTIKVSTGPINGSVSTSIASTSTPQPAIRCAVDSPESTMGTSQSTPDSPSLTSIVYCSSGGDDTPFTVHLPGGDNTKPLGSSENPIQLVQQGNTFQALQPVQERQLQQITSLLQQRRITAPPTTHHDEIYDPKTNMKIVYKVVYPEDIVHLNEDDDDGDDIIWEEGPEGASEKRRGRKPKDWRKAKMLDEGEDVDVEILEEREGRKNHVSRTRSGRISRPPRHMMKDFKHLHPVNFNDDDKDRDAPGIGYSDYDVQHQADAEEKPVEPVILELPPRKKREVPPLTRLRYTCLTCGKLYMGRIEAHYRKFPDHRRERPLLPSEMQQSYSTIKALSSDSAKAGAEAGGEEGGEVNKSVLSPTPGTQASETSGEPSLPMETLTTRPLEAQAAASHTKAEHAFEAPDFLLPETTPVKPSRGRGRGRRGRRGRGRGGRFSAPGRPPTSVAKPPPTPVPSPITMLEKILGGYSGEEILQAVGQRLLEALSPWQLLCFQAKRAEDKGDLQSWQGRVQYLEQLLRECKEDFHLQLQQSTNPKARQRLGAKPLSQNVFHGADKYANSNLAKVEGAQLFPGKEEGVALGALPLRQSSLEGDVKDASGDEPCESTDAATKDNIQITADLASALGVASGFYRLRDPVSDSQESPDGDSGPVDAGKNSVSRDSQVHLGEKHKMERNEVEISSPTKKMRLESEEGVEVLASASKGCPDSRGQDLPSCLQTSEQRGKIAEDSTQSLPLPSFTMPSQMPPMSSLASTLCPSTSAVVATAGSGTLSSSLVPPTFSLSIGGGGSGGTTLTDSQTTTMPITTSSAMALEVPTFNGHSGSNSMPVISSCLQMPSLETSMVTTSALPQVPQVPPMQQMAMGDLDITADDLPRLLSEGTGLVVGTASDGSDACEAPKLLDTSGDTSDLSEMLMKLQEVTASIGNGQETKLEQPGYQAPIIDPSHQMMTATGGEMALTSQAFNPLGQNMATYTSTSDLKLGTSESSGAQPSMPLLTFSGALDSNADFQTTATTTTSSASSNLGSTAGTVVKLQPEGMNQSGTGEQGIGTQPISLGDERESLGFSVTEFEELLKR